MQMLFGQHYWKKEKEPPEGNLDNDDDATRTTLLVTVDSGILDRWRTIDLLFQTIQHTSTIINCNACYRVAF